MKFLDKLGLVIFSILVLILSVVALGVTTGWIALTSIVAILKYVVANDVPTKIAIITSIVLGVYALKCIFFNSFSGSSKDGKDSILLESENGKLLVSKDTIENITNKVIKKFDTAETVSTKVEFDEENNLNVYITLFVKPETVIKDLASNVQKEVKTAVKNSIDIEPKSVNIRVRNIVNKKDTEIKAEEK